MLSALRCATAPGNYGFPSLFLWTGDLIGLPDQDIFVASGCVYQRVYVSQVIFVANLPGITRSSGKNQRIVGINKRTPTVKMKF